MLDRQAARLEIIKVCAQTVTHQGIDNVLASAKRYEEFVFAPGDDEPVEPTPAVDSSKIVENVKKRKRQQESDNDPFS